MNASGDASQPAARRFGKWLFRLFLGLIVLALLGLQRGTLEQLGQTGRGVSSFVLAGAIVFYLAGQALSAWKWRLLLQFRGVQVSWRDCFGWYLAGMFGNLWLPTNIGGDALRAVLLAPRCSKSEAAASIAVERLTGFAALLGLAGVALAWNGVQNGQTTRILLLSLAILLVLGVFWTLLSVLSRRFPSHFLARKVRSLSGALSAYLAPAGRPVLIVALALSLVFQASQVVLNIALARAVGLPVPDAVFWWLGPILSLSGLVPIGIGGLGVREAAALALLKHFPAPAGQIVAWSLLWQATVWGASLPGVWWIKQRRK